MIPSVIFNIVIWMLASLGLCLGGALITYWVQGKDASFQFIEYWLVNFNGLMIGGTAWGLAAILTKEAKGILNRLLTIIDVDIERSGQLLNEFRKTYDLKRIILLGLPVAICGGVSLIVSGFPLNGFSQIYLAAGSISIHFIGSFILIHFLYTIKFYKYIDSKYAKLRFKRDFSPLDLESFNTFYIVIAAISLLAAYLSFRGTLTAGFSFPPPFNNKLLIYPILAYFPIGLLYSFYPRYVLKKIYERRVIDEINSLDLSKFEIKNHESMPLKEKLQLEEVIASLKEKLIQETKQYPLINPKDYPSFLIIFVMFSQFILSKDSVVSQFFKMFTE